MFFSNLLPLEYPIMEAFIQFKVREIINILFKDDSGCISRNEVPYLVRYFLQFPSQIQVVDEILPEIEKLESQNDKNKDLIEIDAFEKHLVRILKLNLYPGNDKETLIEAFRVLDSEKNGYIDLHTFYTFVKSFGVSFTKKQIEEMENFLIENETELLDNLGVNPEDGTKYKHTPTTARKFYYEAYVRMVMTDDQKHFGSLMLDYKAFVENYRQNK